MQHATSQQANTRLTERHRQIAPLGISASLTAPRASLKGKEAVETMADDMRIVVARTGSATREDLALIGWTSFQLNTHGPAAREHADAQATAV